MTVATLRKLTRFADNTSLPETARVVTRSDNLVGPGGVYDLPTCTSIVYICCAMGGCSWRATPRPHYERALYWSQED